MAIFWLVIFRILPEVQRGNCYTQRYLFLPLSLKTKQEHSPDTSWQAGPLAGEVTKLFTKRENFGGLHCFKTPEDHVGQLLGDIIEHLHNQQCGNQNSTNPQKTVPFRAACRVEFQTPHSSVSYCQKTLI